MIGYTNVLYERGIDSIKGRKNLEIVEMKPNLKNLNNIHREKSGKRTGNTFWNCPFSISAFSVGSECKVPSDLRGGICLPSDLLCFYKSPESFHTVGKYER
jgi:hypothetical protein